MGPPSSTPAAPQTPTPQSHGSGQQQIEGQPALAVPIQSIHQHVAQIGRVDAVGPPSPENPIPTPPNWLKNALNRLQNHYPNDIFGATMRYTAVSTTTDLPIPVHPDPPPPDNVKYMYYPRVKCRDCPGKLYTPGPELGVNNFEIHLKNRIHREKVERRVAATAANGTANRSSSG